MQSGDPRSSDIPEPPVPDVSPRERLDAPAPIATRRRLLILGLVLVHLAAGPILGSLSDRGRNLPTMLFIGQFFCQTSLLGFWSALGTNRWWQRLAGLLLGTTYLGGLMVVSQDDFQLVILVVSAILLVAGPLQVVRWHRGSLQHVRDTETVRRPEALQFSIRHLLVATLVVACLVAALKYTLPFTDRWDVLLSVSLAFVAVGLAGCWAMLGTRHVWLRTGAALALSATTGAATGWLLMGGWNGEYMQLWTFMTTLQCALFIASLGIVRLAGYRLLREKQSPSPR